MMSPAVIFATLTDGISSALGSEWSHSSQPPTSFLNGGDGAQRAHRSYHIAVPNTVYQSRQRGPVGCLTEWSVMWLYRIRTGYRTQDYTAALVSEETVMSALAALALTHTITRGPIRSERDAGDAGYFLVTEVGGSVLHTLER
jgi:hypothetical protein